MDKSASKIERHTYRDKKGQFAVGYKGGPGRPKISEEEKAIRRQIRRKVRKESKKFGSSVEIAAKNSPAIMTKLVELAIQGDTQAAKICLDRAYGLPVAMERKVNLQGIEELPPLERQEKLLKLVSQGQIGIESAKEISRLLSNAINDSQLLVISRFINDVQTIGPQAAAQKALGDLK